MFTLDWFSFVLLSFATFRLARLVAADLIVDGLRARATNWAYKPSAGKIRGRIGDLITCRWCAGWWIAGTLVAVWTAHVGALTWDRWIETGIEWCAVAGAAGLLGTFDRE